MPGDVGAAHVPWQARPKYAPDIGDESIADCDERERGERTRQPTRAARTERWSCCDVVVWRALEGGRRQSCGTDDMTDY